MTNPDIAVELAGVFHTAHNTNRPIVDVVAEARQQIQSNLADIRENAAYAVAETGIIGRQILVTELPTARRRNDTPRPIESWTSFGHIPVSGLRGGYHSGYSRFRPYVRKIRGEVRGHWVGEDGYPRLAVKPKFPWLRYTNLAMVRVADNNGDPLVKIEDLT